MNKISVGVFAVAVCAAVSVLAETWHVFSHDAKPTKDGAEQGDAAMSPAAQLAYAVANAASGSDIRLQKGLYDFSEMTSLGSPAAASGYIYIPTGRTLHFHGEGEKHWSEKTREEETILSGSVGAPLVYGVNGVSRCSKFYGISFENSTNTCVDAGAAIAMTANERYKDTPPGLVSNCVFRNCRSTRPSAKGGATSYISAFDCFYTNCTSLGKGGGAYGGDHLISGGAWHSTNTFLNCTFIGCSGSSGGGLYCERNPDYEKVSGCTFINCSATGTAAHGGGAYFGSFVKGLSDCVFEHCTTKGGGGGLWLAGGADYLRGCRFVGNTSPSSYGGGGFRSEGAMPLELTNCSFTDNTSTSGYGGNASAKTFGAVTDCVFKGGRAAKGAGVNAGVTSAEEREPANGDFVRCVFEDNQDNDRGNDGSHVNNALSLTDCRFTGWGDVWARTVDRCSFVACEYYPNDGSDNDGLVRLADGVTTPENIGRVRNCLFARCLAPVLIENESYYNAEIANCTFADNILTNAVQHDGAVLCAWKATPPGESATCPATNLISNCIFWNNLVYKYGDQSCERDDPRFYRATNTGVGQDAANIVQNCIYGVKGIEEPQRATNFKQVNSPKFVKDFVAETDVLPGYMPMRSSPVCTFGIWEEWMTLARDLAGTRMPTSAPVDVGCYQSEAGLDVLEHVNCCDVEGKVRTVTDVPIICPRLGRTLKSGWYAVCDMIELDSLTVDGEVHLILCDGAKLTATAVTNEAGIAVTAGNSLTIYGQELGTGELVAKNKWVGDGKAGACIGGVQDKGCGTVTINGGTITAISETYGAGIGGAYGGTGGSVTINGGKVTARGLNSAGIGNGCYGSDTTVTINGGTVEASHDNTAADIGAGYYGASPTVTINGGNVKAETIQNAPTNSANAAVWRVTVNVEKLNVEKLNVEGLDGYGTRDIYPIEGKVYLYLPDGTHLFRVNDQWYVAAVQGAATVATPKPVKFISAKQRWPWNGKVDIVAFVAELDAEKDGYRLVTTLALGGVTNRVCRELSAGKYATYTNTVDCAALFGTDVVGEMSVKLSLEQSTGETVDESDGESVAVDTRATKEMDVSAGAVTVNLTYSGDGWSEAVGGSAAITVAFEGGTEEPLVTGLTGAGVVPWNPKFVGTYVFKHTAGCVTETAVFKVVGIKGPWSVGDGVTAYVSGNGALVIGGTGAMNDFARAADVPWAAVADQVTAVTVEDGVTLGKNALAALSNDVLVTFGLPVLSVGSMKGATGGYEPPVPVPPAGAVTTWDALTNAIAMVEIGATVAVGADIAEAGGELVIPAGKAVAIKLYGKAVSCRCVTVGGALTVGDETDSVGRIVASDGAKLAKSGSVTLLNGPVRGTFTTKSPGVALVFR